MCEEFSCKVYALRHDEHEEKQTQNYDCSLNTPSKENKENY